MDLRNGSTYNKTCETISETAFLSEGQGTGKAAGEIAETKKRTLISKIPDYWAAKYKCILMGVILFFSVAEIIMFNVNNFLQGESTRNILYNIIEKYFSLNTTLKSVKDV